jgi:hypothetical protein
MIDGDDCGAVGGMNEWQYKPECREETCPSAALCNHFVFFSESIEAE